jgi:hypothetical protein
VRCDLRGYSATRFERTTNARVKLRDFTIVPELAGREVNERRW